MYRVLSQNPRSLGSYSSMTCMMVQFVIGVSISLALTGILLPFWVEHVALFHTVWELACVFIALTAFVIIWHTYDQNASVNLLIGVGFLALACFDTLHTFFFPYLQLIPSPDSHLATWYWLLGRLTAAIVLCAATFGVFHIRIQKHLLGTVALTFILLVSFSIYHYVHLLPALWLEGQGASAFKATMEYLITSIFIFTLIRLIPRINDRDMLTYRYIFLALLLSVSAEICFTLTTSAVDFYNIFGHMLKLASYYYLFRGIILSALTYPYMKLERAGDYLSRVLDSLPQGILTYDRNSTVSCANQKAGQILVCNPRELTGLTAKEVVARFDRVDLNEIGGNPALKRNLVEITNGRGERLKLKMDTVSLDDDVLLCLFEEAKLEQEIVNLQLQTQTILNSINNLAIMLDIRQQVVMCNRLWEETVEISSGMIMGMNVNMLYELIQLSDRSIADRALRGERLTREVSLITLSGKRLELRCDSAPILNVDGEIIGAILIGSDITELRRRQRMIQQQEKLAVLGEMAAGIVHEIRNPLTTIKGFMQLIAAQTEDEICRKYADLIRAEVDEVNQVVSDFLNFAQPRKPVLKEISLNQFVLSIGAFWERQIYLRGIELKINPAEQDKPVLVDEKQFKQALTNIVKNSADAMSSTPSPRLTITVGYDSNRDRMTVAIADNGTGISGDELSKLCNPFYTTKDRRTGLGLSICYQIITEHRGSILVDSEPGQGAAFTISLPLSDRPGSVTSPADVLQCTLPSA